MSEHSFFNPHIYRVTSFEIIDNYTIRLTFDDQSERVIDFEPILSGPVFGPLKERELFRQATINENFGTLEWPNGADIAPNVLHDWPEHVDAIIERRKQEPAIDH